MGGGRSETTFFNKKSVLCKALYEYTSVNIPPLFCVAACVELGLKTADLLKLFNSRACQLVLGAGAVSLAGLKTITIRYRQPKYQYIDPNKMWIKCIANFSRARYGSYLTSLSSVVNPDSFGS